MDTRVVECVVTAVLRPFQQTSVETADGSQYAITNSTAGVGWLELKEGQRVRCLVTNNARVIRADLIDS